MAQPAADDEERVIKIDSLKAQLDKQEETDNAALTDLEKRKKADSDRAADAIKNLQLVATQEKQGSDDLIGRLQEQKRIFDETEANTLDKLREEMQGRRDDHAEILSQIEEQKRRIQEAANKELEAMQNAAAKASEALQSGVGSPAITAAAAGGGLAAGIAFAKNLDAENIGKKAGVELEKAIKSGDWKAVGEKVGGALESGITTALALGFDKWTHDTKIGGVSLADIGNFKDFFATLWSDINNPNRNNNPDAPGVTINPNISIPNDFPNGGAGRDPDPARYGGMTTRAGGMAELIPHIQETNRLLASIANDTGAGWPGSAAASRQVA